MEILLVYYAALMGLFGSLIPFNIFHTCQPVRQKAALVHPTAQINLG
jgi:hypothetical protein